MQGLAIKIFKMIFTKIIIKKAEEYVASTSNEYDDKALIFLIKFVNSL